MGKHTIPPETPDENIFAMYAAAGISREEIFDHATDLRQAQTAAVTARSPRTSAL
ncbi:MAG: hypothetical protein M1546_23205 [Chloroflexi bacterium]|nr:hypothetical protein [Chloroflexota bacterium]